jgi:hypothetical protein
VQLAPTLQVVSDLFAQISPYIYTLIDSLTNAINITFITQTAFDTLRKVLTFVGQTLVFVAKVLTPILKLLIDISGYLITGAVGAWRVFSEFVFAIVNTIKGALEGIINTIYAIGEALGIVTKQATEFDKKLAKAKGENTSPVIEVVKYKKKAAGTEQASTLQSALPTSQMPTAESNIKAGIAGVQGDSKAARNITININGALIETMQVNSGMDLQGIETSVKDSALKGIMTALRDTSLMAGE